MNELISKHEYDILIKKSLFYKGRFSTENELYFDKDYLESLFQHLKRENLFEIFDKEVCKKDGRPEKMGSVASSARLCYLYFHDPKFADSKIQYEHQANCLGIERAKANLDAFSEKNGTKTYYECKCHEFVEGEGEVFVDSYQKIIKDLFELDSIQMLPCITKSGHLIKSKSGKQRYYLKLSQKEMNINVPSEQGDSLYDMHFNVKQLICHLLGIANEIMKDKEDGLNNQYVLHYVFFVPSPSLNDDALNSYYSLLENEIEAISKSKIQDFAEKHGITLNLKGDLENKIDVGTIEDFVSPIK